MTYSVPKFMSEKQKREGTSVYVLKATGMRKRLFQCDIKAAEPGPVETLLSTGPTLLHHTCIYGLQVHCDNKQSTNPSHYSFATEMDSISTLGP